MGRKIERIKVVGSGKKFYLEFLRNLTPQVLLFSFVLIVGRKLDFSTIDLGNWLQTAIFFVLLIAFIAAVYANYHQLFSGCYSGFGKWSDKIRAASAWNNRNGMDRVKFVLCAILRTRKLELAEILFVVFFLQVVIAIIVVTAIGSATRLIGAA